MQKDLWVEVGGKLDFGKDEAAARAAFQKMGEQNGWAAIGYIYSKVRFDTYAPTAHLPSYSLSDEVGMCVLGEVLFSRIETCKA